MKNTLSSLFVAATIVAASGNMSPAIAQSTDRGAATGTSSTASDTGTVSGSSSTSGTDRYSGSRSPGVGWLGLVGLFGLAGLLRKDPQHASGSRMM